MSEQRLRKILETMQIPEDKLDPDLNIEWLVKWLAASNAAHPDLPEALNILKELLFDQRRQEGRI